MVEHVARNDAGSCSAIGDSEMGGVAQGASRARLSRVQTLVAVGFVVAAGLIATLALEVRSLRSKATELMARRSFPYESQWVPTVRAATLLGDSVTIGETTPGRTQVLIAFSVTCPHSLASLPAWKRISAALLADSARRADVYW